MSPFDKRMHYKNIHSLIFGLWRLSTNLSNTPRMSHAGFEPTLGHSTTGESAL